jgi:malic enzyme
LYPRLRDIRQVSLAIATKVAEQAHALGLARRAPPLDIEGYVYEP